VVMFGSSQEVRSGFWMEYLPSPNAIVVIVSADRSDRIRKMCISFGKVIHLPELLG
jgi:hypothetical protein